MSDDIEFAKKAKEVRVKVTHLFESPRDEESRLV